MAVINYCTCLFKCDVALECIDPPPIINGFYLPTNGPYRVGFEATYQCNNGYQIRWPVGEEGKTTIFCMKNAQWSRDPTCIGEKLSYRGKLLLLLLFLFFTLKKQCNPE